MNFSPVFAARNLEPRISLAFPNWWELHIKVGRIPTKLWEIEDVNNSFPSWKPKKKDACSTTDWSCCSSLLASLLMHDPLSSMRLNIGGRKTNVASRKNYAAIALKINRFQCFLWRTKGLRSVFLFPPICGYKTSSNILNWPHSSTHLQHKHTSTRGDARRERACEHEADFRGERDGNGHSETTNPISIRVWRILDWWDFALIPSSPVYFFWRYFAKNRK
jgi:hypothetical protein